jgi:hypothetical protein
MPRQYAAAWAARPWKVKTNFGCRGTAEGRRMSEAWAIIATSVREDAGSTRRRFPTPISGGRTDHEYGSSGAGRGEASAHAAGPETWPQAADPGKRTIRRGACAQRRLPIPSRDGGSDVAPRCLTVKPRPRGLAARGGLRPRGTLDVLPSSARARRCRELRSTAASTPSRSAAAAPTSAAPLERPHDTHRERRRRRVHVRWGTPSRSRPRRTAEMRKRVAATSPAAARRGSRTSPGTRRCRRRRRAAHLARPCARRIPPSPAGSASPIFHGLNRSNSTSIMPRAGLPRASG